jgi:hypothetical protein
MKAKYLCDKFSQLSKGYQIVKEHKNKYKNKTREIFSLKMDIFRFKLTAFNAPHLPLTPNNTSVLCLYEK